MNRRSRLKQILYGSAGAAYGACLTVLGFLCAGFGHGSYLPIGIAGSPLSLIHIPLSIFVPVVLWTGLGLLLYKGDPSSRKIILWVLAAQYLGAIALFFVHPHNEFEYIWRSMKQVGLYVFLFVMIYTLGQIGLWAFLVKAHFGKIK